MATLNGTAGPDTIVGTDQGDNISGLAGNDTLKGLAGDDTLDGGSGDDFLDGGPGSDTLIGGTGHDRYYNVTAGDVIIEAPGEGSDWLSAGGSYTLAAGVSIEAINTTSALATTPLNLTGNEFDQSIYGNDGINILSGLGGNDVLVALGGDDTLNGGTGNDSLDGGPGSDTASYSDAGSAVTVSLSLAGAQDTIGAGTDTLVSIENLTGSAFADTLSGNGSANLLSGLAGNDILSGLAGDDILNGGAGDDSLDGGADNDTATYFDAAGAVVVSLNTAGAQNTGAGVDTLSNIENLTGSQFNDTLTGNSSSNVLSGLAGNDTLSGLDGDDTLNGGSGDDFLEGGPGADTLIGGTGHDRYYDVGTGDVIIEAAGEGSDWVSAGSSYALAAGVSIEAMNTVNASATSAINLSGNEFDQSIYGNDGANILSGMGGNDILSSQAGDDTLIGGTGSDQIDGGDGTDTAVFAGNKADYIIVKHGGGSWTVTHIASGDQDTLSNIEQLQFDDALIDASTNTAPTATSDSYSLSEDTTLNIVAPGVLANDTDAEGNSLTAVLVNDVSNGTLTLNSDGSFDYTPDPDFNGSDSFTYKPNDGTVDGTPVTVSLTVNPVNDPPTATADGYSTNEDTALVIPAPGVLANDSDIDGNSLTSAIVSDVSHGTLGLNADGSFTYTPNADFNGSDSFSYKPNDGTTDGNTVTVNITVNSINDAPIANADVGTANEDTGVTVNAAVGVLSNDTDVDGDSLTVTAVTGGTVGTPFALASGAILTLNADGSYTYNTNGKFEALRPGETATDTFTYTASDGHGGSNSATATITINGANEVPVGTNDTYNGVTGNTPFSVNAANGVLANDTDPDQPHSGLSVTKVNGTDISSGAISVTGGSVTMNADGGFTFNPSAGFTGAASFSYTVSDADGGTSTATSTINVSGLVWYVDASYAGANGAPDGTFNRPFTDLTQLNGVTGDGTTNDDVDGANDTIFVYNTGTYTGGITLEAGQVLYGDSHSLTVNGIQIGAANSSNSTINHTGAGITLSTNNTIDGVTLNGTATGAVGIQDGNGTVGTLNITNTAISGQGQIVDIDQGGTLNVSLSSAASTGSSVNNGGVIDLTGVTGTFTVTGTTTINGTQAQTGIDLTGNTSLTSSFNGLTTVNTGAQQAANLGANTTSTTNFTSGLDIDTTTAAGLSSNSGNTLAISGGTNTINTTTGQILNLANTAVGASGITFTSLGASGTVAATAINLTNLDGNSFNGGTVTISGTTGAASDGIFIGGGSSTNFTFAGATIGATGDEGIEINGAGNGTVSLTTVAINGSGGNGVEINGSDNSVTISGGTIGNTDDPAGDAVNVTNGTGAVSIGATITKTTAGNVVEVNNHDAGNVTFSGNLSATGGVNNGVLVTGSNGGTITFSGQTINIATGASAGVSLTNNSGATINFTPAGGGNGLDIATTSGVGFGATGGGTVSVTGSGNTISSTNGTALNISSTNIGAGDVTFQSISAGNASNTAGAGIILDTTGSAGGLHVTGSGTAGSGGTIQHFTGANILTGSNGSGQTTSGTAGTGIFLNNTSDVQLSWMQLHDFQNFGIYGNNVTGFTLDHSTINGINGDNNAGDREEASIRFDNLHTDATYTSASISNSTISGGATGNILFYNTNGTLDRVTLNNNTFGLISSTIGNDNVDLTVYNSATAKITVTNNIFQGTRGDFFEAVANNNATLDVVARSNDFNNGQAIIPGGGTGISVRSGSAGNVSAATTTFDISNNTINDGGANAFDTVGIFVAKGQDLGTLVGTIQGNTLVAKTGSNSDGIFVRSNGKGTTTVLIQNNTITNWGNAGIHLQNNDGSGTMNASVFGNSVTAPGAGFNTFAALFADNGATATDTNTMNLVVGSATDASKQNTLSAGGVGVVDVSLSNFNSNTHLNLSKNGSASGTVAGVIADDNVGTPSADTSGGSGPVTLVNTLPTLPPVVAPLQAAMVPSHPVPGPAPSQAELDALVTAAIQRWADAGATADQLAAMSAVVVTVADLGGVNIGSSETSRIVIDDNAGGWGWFIDGTPGDDFEFSGSGTSLTALPGTAAAGHIDLLTVIMHELGHQVGLNDAHSPGSSDNLMYGYLDPGERHIPQTEGTDLANAESASARVQGWIAAVTQNNGDEGQPLLHRVDLFDLPQTLVNLFPADATALGGTLTIDSPIAEFTAPGTDSLHWSIAYALTADSQAFGDFVNQHELPIASAPLAALDATLPLAASAEFTGIAAPNAHESMSYDGTGHMFYKGEFEGSGMHVPFSHLTMGPALSSPDILIG